VNERGREGEGVRGRAREAWVFAAGALVCRLALVAWAGARFKPVEDGFYYDTFARRLAHGDGYTWLWPDGAVTYAAHYPVGYPALVAPLYAIFGESPAIAMTLNAVVGALGVYATLRLLDGASRGRARVAGVVLALHPALLAYTPALMTEGVTASILAVAAFCASRARARAPLPWLVASGVAMGIATLVRPQSMALAPFVGALAIGAGWSRRLGAAGLVTALALACCAPWTVRNCARMDRCALVSVNGGWNLLIGVRSTTGGWAPVDPPPDECREVWSEAQKDVCFERTARAAIARAPFAWLTKVPAKLATTLDYFGAAPWYLHASNAAAFDDRAKVALGAMETIFVRALLLLALARAALFAGPRVWARRAVAAGGGVLALLVHAWPAYLALALTIALVGRRRLVELPLVVPFAAIVVVATAAIHAVFFGAGRYGLVLVPFVTALAFVARDDRATPTPPL
jgi:hypothetical protein